MKAAFSNIQLPTFFYKDLKDIKLNIEDETI